MESTHLPLVRAPPDVLRSGWSKASEDIRPVHPVQRLETYYRKNEWENKMATIEQIYGKAAAMRLRTEKAIMEQFERLPGLPSSRVGLETIMGTDDQIDFKDVLNDPIENPHNVFHIHEAMEIKYGIF